MPELLHEPELQPVAGQPEPLDTIYYPGTGDPQEPVTGDKAIFGDLGNDFIVAGAGRSQVFAGNGNDYVDLRAQTNVDGGLNDLPVPDVLCGTPPDLVHVYDLWHAGVGEHGLRRRGSGHPVRRDRG